MIRTKSDLEEMVFLTIVQRLPEVFMINEFINADLCQTYDSAAESPSKVLFHSSHPSVVLVLSPLRYESGKAERFVLSSKLKFP